MHNIQTSSLQNYVVKKFHQDHNCLRKIVGHQSIQAYIQLVTRDNNEILKDQQTLYQTLEARKTGLQVGLYEETRKFESKRSVRTNVERFAALSLESDS